MNKRQIYLNNLWNLSPLSGREILYTHGLGQYLSEGALHRYRAETILKLFIALSESGLEGFPSISPEQKAIILGFAHPDRFDASAVAEYDHFGRNGIGPLEHDVKAVELYLRELFDQHGLGHLKELLYFPPTSEDINNLAWNCMVRDSINHEWLPKLLQVCKKLRRLSMSYSIVPVVGITHGMPASPTTIGKRFAYFLDKLINVLQQLQTLRLSGKFSGPVGNHNAMTAVMPNFNMERFAQQFVESFSFRYEAIEHQRNCHIELVRLLKEINLINVIGADLCEHIRHSVMMGWLQQEAKDGTVGSSVMPHKINPWFFEVGQGYFEQSISQINAAEQHLVQSVFERDLTDHPWERSYGEMIGKSLVGLSYVCDGLDTIKVNQKLVDQSLEGKYDILTEGVQIAGRWCGVENPYMLLKEISRGKNLSLQELQLVIHQCIPNEEIKKRLMLLRPGNYTGKASDHARLTAMKFKSQEPSFMRGLLFLNEIKAVLFDFDQTLHFGDKDELFARLTAINVALRSGFSEEEIKEFGNRSDYKEMRALMVEAHNKKHQHVQVTEEQFTEENNKVSGTLDHHFILAPHAIPLLSFLKEKGIKLGLVTTRGSNSLPRLLEKHGIAKYFDAIISRDDTAERKPAPEPLILALEKLKVTGSEAVYIGDKQEDDVPPARILGMKSILVCDVCYEELQQPTLHCTSLEKAKEYLETII